MKMDPPLINDSSFSSANPSAYTLAEIWPLSAEPDQSSLTVHSGVRKRPTVSSEDDSSKIVSTTTTANDLKTLGTKDEHGGSKAEVETSSVVCNKPAEEDIKSSEPPKQDYVHVRARRGQATDSHSLAERARREKISERMKILQDLVPGCNKVIGIALVLDEIINYVQSLQHQVEFLSMKLEAVNSRMNMHPSIEAFPSKDAMREYAQGSHPEWLHMQVGGSFERAT